MRKTLIVTTIAVFLLSSLVLAPSPAEAQKKGQSAKIQHGVIVKSERVDLSENKVPSGALVGGTIGLMTGGSSGNVSNS